MHHPRIRRIAPLLMLTAIALAGCSSDGDGADDSTDTNAELRLANATGGSSLVLNAVGVTDDDVKFSSGTIAVGAASDYLSAEPQTYTVGVSATDGTLIASTQSLGLASGTSYTLLAFERSAAVNTYAILEGVTEPSAGFTTLRVANAAGDAGSLDVYLVAPDTSLNGVSPAYSSVTAKSTSSARTITSGSYDVVVTAAGKPADRRLTMSSVALPGAAVLTLALTSTIGGGLVNGAVVQQDGPIAVFPATTARVRVVGAFPATESSNTIVTTTIGGTSLARLTAPSVGAYALVHGDTSEYTVSVDGVPVAGLPAFTFENGGDYTILAYGSAADPGVAVFVDNNQPSSSGAANLRLVNAAVQGGGLTLTDDYVPINVDVQYGTASGYSPATPSTTSLLQITSPVAAFPTYLAGDVSILGSGVYSIFVLGSTAAPLVVFAKDR